MRGFWGSYPLLLFLCKVLDGETLGLDFEGPGEGLEVHCLWSMGFSAGNRGVR